MYSYRITQSLDEEIDFVAEKKGERLYLQVALEATSPSAREREFGAFEGIVDNHPKYILTLEQGPGDNIDGITKVYLPDFLLKL